MVGRTAHGSHVASGISVTGRSALTTGQDMWGRGQVPVPWQGRGVAAATNSGFVVTDRGLPGPHSGCCKTGSGVLQRHCTH